MKFIKVSLSLLFMLGLCLVACKKNNEVTPAELPTETIDLSQIKVSVSNGKLIFFTNEDMSDAIELVNKASESAFQAWEKSIGFKSAATVLSEAAAQMELGTSPEELVNTTPKLLKYENESLTLSVPYGVSRIVNAEKCYYVGSVLYKHSEEGEYVSLDGSFTNLNLAEETKSSKEGVYYFFSNVLEGANERVCGYWIPSQELENSTQNRKSILLHTLTIIRSVQSNELWRVENICDVTGRSQKKNAFGNWANYNTDHNLSWNFSLSIANKPALHTLGASFPIEHMTHTGNSVRSSSRYISYSDLFFKVIDVPYSTLSYADPSWKTIANNRHNHQGMNGAWNAYSCF